MNTKHLKTRVSIRHGTEIHEFYLNQTARRVLQAYLYNVGFGDWCLRPDHDEAALDEVENMLTVLARLETGPFSKKETP